MDTVIRKSATLLPAAVRSLACALLALPLVLAAPTFTADASPEAPPVSGETGGSAPDEPPLDIPPGEAGYGVHSDPLAWFNEPMFTFNLKLDDWVISPVARGYAFVAPDPVREAVGRFFDNARIIPRVANNALQLRLLATGTELARFGVNSTVGLLGFFDPAQHWFGLNPEPNDFGLTLRRYGVPGGYYLMIPFFGPSTLTDAVGLAADASMDPLWYFVPVYVSVARSAGQFTGEAVNYRSLHLDQFAEVDRYAVDLYGAVQDAYIQTREHRIRQLRGEGE
jgi:phospholipid-binding lipoprotein MlaA